jgi:hypothetical protein
MGVAIVVLRCRQMVAAENEGQCFRLNVLYDWGAIMSMVSREAMEMMGLSPSKQAKRIIKGLGGETTVSKGTCTLTLVARNGDRRTVTAWEVGDIASIPGGQPRKMWMSNSPNCGTCPSRIACHRKGANPCAPRYGPRPLDA